MKTRKYLKLLTAAFMLVLFFALIPQMNTEAASTKKKALNAYKTFMEYGRSENGRSLRKFGTALITKDNVPELICDDSIWTYVYTFKNGKMKLIYEGESYNVYTYYKKKNMIVEFYAHRGLYNDHYLKYSNGSFSEVLHKESYGSGGATYYKCKGYKETKIKKSKFNSLLKSYKGSAKETKIKMYDNTAKQLKKRLK